MSAYVIFVLDKVMDPAALAEYRRIGGPSLRGTNGKMVIKPSSVEVLEGGAIDSVVALEFPTTEEAKAWYYSPLYQEALKHRLAGAVTRAFIAPGM